jgi:hypothetical protein
MVGGNGMSRALNNMLIPKNAATLTSNTAALAECSNQMSAIKAGPKGAKATADALNSALPTGDDGVYVVIANGNLYYWNGSAWTDTGIQYQSSGVADLSVALRNTFLATRSINLIDEATDFWKQGRYNNTAVYSITSDPLLLSQGETYYFTISSAQLTAYNIGTMRVDWFDVSDTFISSQTILNNATFVPTENANITYGRLNLQTNVATDLIAPSDVVNLEVIIAESSTAVSFVPYYTYTAILPEIVLDSSLSGKINKLPYIIDIKQLGAKGDGETLDTTIFQSALNLASTYGMIIIYVPDGTYNLDDATLSYSGNTKIVLSKNAILDFGGSFAFISNRAIAATGNDYNLGSFEIEGGTIISGYTSADTGNDSAVCIEACQLSLLSIKNIKLIDCSANGHLFDISGCKRITIDNVDVVGMHLPPAFRPTQEADYSYLDGETTMYTDHDMIQIDMGTGLGFGTETDPSVNVEITNVVFRPNPDNTNSIIYRPIGMHSVGNDYYRNIKIENIKIYNPQGRVLSFTKTKNLSMKNVYIESTLDMYSDIIRLRLTQGAVSNDIENVSIENFEVNITGQTNSNKFFNVVGADEYYAKNVEIKRVYAPALSIALAKCDKVLLAQNDVLNIDATGATNVLNLDDLIT